MKFKDLPIVEPKIFDSTAVTLFKECPRKYMYRMKYGYAERTTYPYFAFGTAYHKFRETLEAGFREIFPDPHAITLQSDLDQFLQPAIIRAVEHWTVNAMQAEIDTKWDFLTTERLLKSCTIAFIHWKKEKHSKRIIVLATEQSFLIELEDGTTTGGRADQIVRDNGRVWGRDFKTSSISGPFYERTLVPNDQFTRYTHAESTLSGEQVQGQIVEVLFNSKKEGPKIIPLRTSRTKYEIDTWVREQKHWLSLMKISRESGIYPMNEKACRFCKYHSICSLNGEDSQVHMLQQAFKVEPWDFQKIHGEDN